MLDFAELPKICAHEDEALTWRPESCNEAGWECHYCGTIGHRLDLDKRLIEEKARAVLFWMNEANLIYISNGTMGDVITANVAERCQALGLYDQHTIIREIMADANLASHAEFWKDRP